MGRVREIFLNYYKPTICTDPWLLGVLDLAVIRLHCRIIRLGPHNETPLQDIQNCPKCIMESVIMFYRRDGQKAHLDHLIWSPAQTKSSFSGAGLAETGMACQDQRPLKWVPKMIIRKGLLSWTHPLTCHPGTPPWDVLGPASSRISSRERIHHNHA